MLRTSNNAWSQADLEELEASSSPSASSTSIAAAPVSRDDRRHHVRKSNGHAASNLPPADNHELIISLDFLHTANEDESTYAQERGGQERGWTGSSPSSSVHRPPHPVLTRQLSLNTSSHISEQGTPPFPPPFSPFAVGTNSPFTPSSPAPVGSPWASGSPQIGSQRNTWYRTTSRLVEASDPVVYSSSSRSKREASLTRSLSRDSDTSQPPQHPDAPFLHSNSRSISHQVRSGDGADKGASPFAGWNRESHASRESHAQQASGPARLHRSASTSRTMYADTSPSTSPWSPVQDLASQAHHQGSRRPVSGTVDVMSQHLSRSASRQEDIGSSPRVLETMVEDAVHEPTSHSDYIGSHNQHSRMRSLSSAASSRSRVPRHDQYTSTTSDTSSPSPTLYDRDHHQYTAIPASRCRTMEPQRPAFAVWNRDASLERQGSYSYTVGGEGDRTARQSPAESRGGSRSASVQYEPDHSPFHFDGLGEVDFEGQPLHQPPNQTHQAHHGSESRRHSIAATGREPSLSGPQRRAVGFELRDSNGPTRSVSVDGERIGSLETETPRSRSHKSQYGDGAFTEDDLAADLGHLQVELDRISAEQKKAEARGLSINFRMPSSQAAATGVHAASMPPLFGGAERPEYPGSSITKHIWDAVPSPSPSMSTSADLRFNKMLTTGSSDLLPVPQSKSRSASVGRSVDTLTLRDRSITERSFPAAEPSAVGMADAVPFRAVAGSSLGHRLSPRAPAFNIGESAVHPRQQLYSGLPPAPPNSLITDPQAGHMRISGGLSSASLKSPSVVGVLQSGVAASGGSSPAGIRSQSGSAAFDRLPRSDNDLNHQQQQQRHIPAVLPQAQPHHADQGAGGNDLPYPSAALNDFTFNSLAGLGAASASTVSGGPPSLQDLGRGVPISSLPRNTPLYIVGFKQGRTDLFFKPIEHSHREKEMIRVDDLVIVEADRGKDIGRVVNDSITVEQVGSFLSSQGAGISSGHPAGKSSTPATRSSISPKRLYAKASPADTSLLASKASDEEKALHMCIQKVQQRNLPMLVISSELQWDRRKLTFYYIASSRVDFRALVADLFKIWKVRIYMSQIPGPEQKEATTGAGGLGGGELSGLASSAGRGMPAAAQQQQQQERHNPSIGWQTQQSLQHQPQHSYLHQRGGGDIGF